MINRPTNWRTKTQVTGLSATNPKDAHRSKKVAVVRLLYLKLQLNFIVTVSSPGQPVLFDRMMPSPKMTTTSTLRDGNGDKWLKPPPPIHPHFAPLRVPIGTFLPPSPHGSRWPRTERRLQTLAVLCFINAPICCLGCFFFLCAIPLLWPVRWTIPSAVLTSSLSLSTLYLKNC